MSKQTKRATKPKKQPPAPAPASPTPISPPIPQKQLNEVNKLKSKFLFRFSFNNFAYFIKGEENNMSTESLKPNTKIGSLEESINYVKKLLMIGVSGIVYLRTIMPATDFVAKKYEGQNIMILSNKDTSKDCKKLRTWMNGAFEALDKKYVT